MPCRKATACRRCKVCSESERDPPFGAIFDWDGVIIDSGKLHEQSWRRLAEELGKSIAPDSFMRGFGMKSARIIEEIHGWAKDPAEIARLTNRKEALYREIVGQSEIAAVARGSGMAGSPARGRRALCGRVFHPAVEHRRGPHRASDCRRRFATLFRRRMSSMGNRIQKFS